MDVFAEALKVAHESDLAYAENPAVFWQAVLAEEQRLLWQEQLRLMEAELAARRAYHRALCELLEYQNRLMLQQLHWNVS